MRLLYIADGRSPIALNWIAHFVEEGHEVHLLSTFDCDPNLNLASVTVVPVAFSGAAGSSVGEGLGRRLRTAALRRLGGVQLRTRLRQWLGPLTLGPAVRQVREVVSSVQPSLVHAMRIPFEGMLAAEADPPAPLLVSVWGNDFTLHAPSSPGMRRLTRRAMRRADALHTDCDSDRRLAQGWGFAAEGPQVVLPGNGGVRMEMFRSGDAETAPDGSSLAYLFRSLTPRDRVVVNPRGLRAYVRNDTFFRAVPRIQARQQGVNFLCPDMAGKPQVMDWLEQFNIRRGVHLLPRMSAAEMAAVFRRAEVSVSPSEHDGTPNTLLEAMAAGAFPIAGDLPCLREWIEDGENGLLVNPGDAEALAHAVLRALEDDGLRERAAQRNLSLVSERASYERVMPQAETFYQDLLA